MTQQAGRIRAAQIGMGVFFLVVAAAFYFRWPVANALWPWPGAYTSLSTLSYTFIASVLAAFAIPLIWIGLSGEIRAAVPITLDVILTLIGVGIFMLQSYAADASNQRPLVGAVLSFTSIPGALAVLRASRKFPLRDETPMPFIVRLTMGLFVIALLIAGYALLTRLPTIFPWPLTPQASVMYGWAFWGAGVYFFYGFLNPKWPYAAGQLIGFIVYALVLFIPYVQLFNDVLPDHRASLIIFLSVLVTGTLIGLYYILIDRRTRFWQRQAAKTAQAALRSMPEG